LISGINSAIVPGKVSIISTEAADSFKQLQREAQTHMHFSKVEIKADYATEEKVVRFLDMAPALQ
jgi:hypothetical protein